MSNFIELKIKSISYVKQKKLLPIVSKWDHAGHFEQDGKKWIIYFEVNAFEEQEIISLLDEEQLNYELKAQSFQLDPDLAWNGMYQPVLVDDYCYIKTPIHPTAIADYEHEITIVPTLSFGMGHHKTTQLMLKIMETLDFENKTILDVGTGTGILGIIAQKENAQKVIAIDTDPLAVENAQFNAQRNKVSLKTKVAKIADLKSNTQADYIFSNISTPVHLASVNEYFFHLKPGGILILSGTLNTDLQKIKNTYESKGFEIIKVLEEVGWIAISLKKTPSI